MRAILFSGLVLALSLVFASAGPLAARAQSGPQGAPLSATDQALVDAFTAAVNGDAGARADFLAKRIAAHPRMPREEFPSVLGAIAATSGGITVVSATRTRSGFVRLLAKAANGKVGRIDLHPSEAEPDRLQGLIGVALPAPFPGPSLAGPADRAALAAAIDRRVSFAAERDDFSGAVLVMKGDEVIYARQVGEADKAAHAPVTAETRFNLGSMDKQFTAVAIGQLVEAGRLSLDDRLIDVLPDYPNREAAQRITIRHLLNHSAGLGMLFERPGWAWKRDTATMGELLPIFAAEPLAYEPGTQSRYSNEGFVVLGAVIEKVTGESWYDYVRTRIFVPAGMTHTAYLTDDPTVPNRATGYKFGDDDPLGFGARRPNWETLSRRGNSCGGGYSTVGDMVRFLQALRAGRLLKPETAALFTGVGGGLPNYGFGFQHIPTANGRTIVGHDGGGPASGINSDAKMIWETGYAYAVLGNYDAPFAQTLGGDIAAMLAVQD